MGDVLRPEAGSYVFTGNEQTVGLVRCQLGASGGVGVQDGGYRAVGCRSAVAKTRPLAGPASWEPASFWLDLDRV